MHECYWERQDKMHRPADLLAWLAQVTGQHPPVVRTSSPGLPVVLTVAATPPGGAYADPPLIILTATSPGTTIRFTTDGSDPDLSASVYEGPILVEADLTLRTRAYGPSAALSPVRTEVYSLTATPEPSGRDKRKRVQPVAASPASEALHIQSDPAAKSFRFQATGDYFDVVDNAGRLIEQRLLAWTQTEVACAGWKPGVYHVRVYGQKGEVTARGRVVK